MKYLIIAAFLLTAPRVNGQARGLSLNKQLTYFLGYWHGAGEFANGRRISANVNFTLSLDSAWVVCHHTDEEPNRYKADSYWGVDPLTKKLTAVVFDNFGGFRNFDGKYNDSLVLVRQNISSKGVKLYQHFIYKQLDPDNFKMTYETSPDSIKWHQVDHLVFKRIR